jgi:cytoskeletal protein RodZ
MDKMMTAGEILHKRRIQKEYTLAEVSAATKIQKHYLKALEKNQFDKFPSDVYTKGFLQNYAKFLEINPNRILALYRRSQGEEDPKPLETSPNIKEQPKIVLTPKLILFVAVGLIVTATLGYLIYQFYNFQSPPALDVTQPSGNISVETKDFVVKGKTEPNMFVTINDEAVRVQPDGNFEAEIALSEGTNTLIIKARHPDNIGKEAVVTRNIEFDTEETEQTNTDNSNNNQDSNNTAEENNDTEDSNNEDSTTTEDTSEDSETSDNTNNKQIDFVVSVTGADAWIEIAIDGEIAYSSTTQAGSSLDFTAENEFSLVTGLISATSITVNGEEQEIFTDPSGIGAIMCKLDEQGQITCSQPE